MVHWNAYRPGVVSLTDFSPMKPPSLGNGMPSAPVGQMTLAEKLAPRPLLQVPKVVPMHFGTFPPLTGRPDELQKLVGTSTQVWALEPGKPVNW